MKRYSYRGTLMKNRKTLKSKDGFTLVESTEVDDNGDVVSVAYEIYDPSDEMLDSFPTQEEAESYL